MRRTLLVIGVVTAVLGGLGSPVHAVERDAGRAVQRDYAAVGDSITAGAGTSNPETRAYPVVAGVAGHGVPGACVLAAYCPGLGILDWFETEVQALPGRPRTVVALIGINDLLFGARAREVIVGLKQLRRLARTMDVRLVFGTLTPTTRRSYRSDIRERRARVNRWIRKRNHFVEYAQAVENRSGWLRAPYDSDGLHLNDEGERVLGVTLGAWLETDAG